MRLFLYLFLFVFSTQSVQAQEDTPKSLIHSIYFGGGSYYIDYIQKKKLNDFLDSFPGIKQYEIVIHSHTDDIGGLEYNKYLSQLRSMTTLQELLKKGLERDFIHINDYGQEHPVYDNSTMEGKLMNRRVDVILKPPMT